MINPTWIAVDWGSSHLHACAMDQNNQVLEHRHMPVETGGLVPEAFEPALLSLINDWLSGGRSVQVLACGAPGAKGAWVATPFVKAPCVPPNQTQAKSAPMSDERVSVQILPGVAQDRPADVMQGEETVIAGYLAKHPKFDGILCLPGAQTKWVHISAGEIVSFRSYMTVEQFQWLSDTSTLRGSLGTDGLDEQRFGDAVSRALSQPETVAEVFSIYAEQLISVPKPVLARSHVLGLLIGVELRATRPYWLGQPVEIIGDDEMAALYLQALSVQGVGVGCTARGELALAGLIAARSGS